MGGGGSKKFGDHSGGPDGPPNSGSANQGGLSVPDFLPPAQRVLFMRIQQKQQEEEERARRLAEGGPDKSRDMEGKHTRYCVTVHTYTCYCLLLLYTSGSWWFLK